MRNFDFNHNGLVSPREARAANDAFLQVAGPDRRRFDWEHRAHHGPPPVASVGPGGWDHQAMRNYHFREGRYGAMFTLRDVLFQTGSAALRPGAEAQLHPLAGYLRANPRVRLRIDGFTDSVGSHVSNMTLSQDRARSVSNALATMGIDPARLQLEGHGEASPVARNDTVDGRQLNRRVEVTLVGQRAASFN
jgi:outer membrane protein OmpA-like peptidoglycan-associated protein